MPNLLNDIAVSERLDSVINDSMGQIKREQKTKRRKRAAAGVLGVTFMLGIGFLFCVNNIAFASRLPLIGNIFSRMKGETSYLGDLSENAQQLVKEETDSALQGENVENPYVQTSNGVTIAITDITYDQKALYMAVSVQSEEAFDKGMRHKDNIDGYILDYDTLCLDAKGDIDCSDESYDGMGTPFMLEGNFVDDHTFIGITSVNMEKTIWPSSEEMEQAGVENPEALSFKEYDALARELFVDVGTKQYGPENFSYDLSIRRIFTEDCFDETTEMLTFPDGEVQGVPAAREVGCEGEWNFHFDIEVSTAKIETVEVNQKNEDGLGISAIQKTPYAISAELIVPEDKPIFDYIVVMCDANGDKLDSQGDKVEEYSPYGRDISTVYVYLCDYIEYMDELKGYASSPDYATRRKTTTFAQYIEEHALFGTEVHFKCEKD